MDLVKESRLPADIIEKLEKRASLYWDEFYRRNRDGFFKTRHWFEQEFEQELRHACNILEVGCGTGSSVYPLLSIRDDSHVYACDFAASAVELVKRNPDYASGRVTGFTADITKDALESDVPIESIDTCLMIFVLSAIKPAGMVAAVGNVNRVLKHGGIVCFRDYCSGDLAQMRMGQAGKQQMIENNFYARGDGTLAYYFEESMLEKVFQQACFEKVHCSIIERTEVNRKSGVPRNRRYLQAVFRKTRNLSRGELGFLMEISPDPWSNSLETEQNTVGRMEKIGAISAILDETEDILVTKCLTDFICTHSDICLNAFTVDISFDVQHSGRLALAALNFSSVHLTIASTENMHRLRHSYNKNSTRYIYERLRLVAEHVWSGRGRTTALQLANWPHVKKKVILISLVGSENTLTRELQIVDDISRLGTMQTHVYIACSLSKNRSLKKRVEDFFTANVAVAIQQLQLLQSQGRSEIMILNFTLS
ncbi:hypothetical protein M9434_002992 [Picochlorum sp. BPE23]|nr:hypothetical protein M9434_002992 [Picochlorum sp. BPE23]